MTDFPDWQAPQAHATAIAATGAPLLGLKTVLGSSAAGQVIASGGQATLLGSVPVGQVGYEMLFNIATSAATATAVIVSVLWSDSSTGLTTDTQSWSVYSGSAGSPHNIRVTGPSNGDRLTVIVSAFNNAITLKWVIMQVSRVYTRHFGHTINPSGVAPAYPGQAAANGNPSLGILCSESQSVAANSTKSLVLPLYAGTARFSGHGGSATGPDNDWRIVYSTDLLTLNDFQTYRVFGGQGFSPAGTQSGEYDNIAMPRTQMIMQLVNNNATTANTLTAHLVTREVQA